LMTSCTLNAGIHLRALFGQQAVPGRGAENQGTKVAWPETDTVIRVTGPRVPERTVPRDWIDDVVEAETDVELDPVVLRWVRDMERNSGLGLRAMAKKQLRFLEAGARAAGVSVGSHVAGEVASNGYGGAVSNWWSSLSTDERNSWRDRAETVFTRLDTESPAEIKRLLRNAAAAGGGIKFLPKEVEELGAHTYAFRRGDVLGVGRAWLEDAESSLEDVYANIAHELGGHLEYGEPLSWLVAKMALNMMSPEQREIAMSGARSYYSAYAYMETEIYAELREHAFRLPTSGGDDPRDDVPNQLARLKKAYEPQVAEAVVRTLRARVQQDTKITADGRRLFDDSIERVFGIQFGSRPVRIVA